jgi:hypothetical protein
MKDSKKIRRLVKKYEDWQKDMKIGKKTGMEAKKLKTLKKYLKEI